MKTSIVYTIDHNFIEHFCVSLTSLLESNPSLFDRYFVITNDPLNNKFKKTANYFKSKYSIEVEILFLNANEIETLKLSKRDHVTKATYLRLMMAEIIPDEIDRILYLDADTIVLGNLEKLCKTTINKKYLLAVRESHYSKHMSPPNKLLSQKLVGDEYFNAGVMLINLKKWREHSVSRKLIMTGKKYDDYLVYWDQDVLNIFFNNKSGDLAKEYNAFSLTRKISPEPAIIHFTGEVKPWHLFSRHPYKNNYNHFRQLTPFKFYIPNGVSPRNIIGKQLAKNNIGIQIIRMKKKLWRTISNIN